MKVSEAIKGYILDAKIEPQTAKHIEQKRSILEERLLSWCEEHGASELTAVTPLTLKGVVVDLQESTISEHDSRISLRGRRLSPVTIKDYTRIVRAFFTWCEKEGYLDGKANPMRSVPRNKLPQRIIHAFSPQQMEALLNVCDLDTVAGFRNYTMLLVFMDTGVRVSELCSLRVGGIFEDYLRVIGKYDKEREVGLSPATVRALWKYVHQYRPSVPKEEDHVFLTRFHEPLDSSYVWKLLQELGAEAEITGVRISPHTLRHSFAKAWLSNGGELIKLSRVLGHTDIQTTQTYLRDFSARDARAEHTKYSPVSTHQLGKRATKKGKKGRS